MITLQLKHGPMFIEIEETDKGFQRVARYHAALVNGEKVLTSRSKVYKTEKGAEKEAQKYADRQQQIFG